MRWLMQSAMIFFGTLMVAGLVALGAPSGLDALAAQPAALKVAHEAAPDTPPQHLADIRWAVQTAAARTQR